MKSQVLMDLIPYTWSQNRQERNEEIEKLQHELHRLQSDNPELTDSINVTIQYLASNSPYFDVVEAFQCSGVPTHPLYGLLQYLNQFSENTITQVVRKVNLDMLNSDSDETEFTYSDPYEKQKKQFNLKMMKRVSFPKLQKLLSDLYRLSHSLSLSWITQIPYVDYVKVSASTLKKALFVEYIDESVIHIVIKCARCQCDCQKYSNQDSPKIQKLKIALHQISKLQEINFESLLTRQQNDMTPLKECIWTRQQVIQCIILFCLIQCEERISGQKYVCQKSDPFCTEEITWSENCFSQIRDYFPKMAKKLNKRYKLIKEIPVFDVKTNNQIFIYAQSLLGYYHHHTNYDNFPLQENLKISIRKIIENQPIACDIGLYILVANAKMYVQLMHALK